MFELAVIFCAVLIGAAIPFVILVKAIRGPSRSAAFAF